MSKQHGIGWVVAIGTFACVGCGGAAAAHPSKPVASAQTSGGFAFVQYDDGYRDGYTDGLRVASENATQPSAVATTAASAESHETDRLASTPAVDAGEQSCIRVEEADVARPGGPIPPDPADPIVATHVRHARHAHR